MALNHVRALKDEIVIGGMLLMITLVSMTTYNVTVLHNAFDPMGFGGGAAALLGAIGGGQGLREWLSNKPAPAVNIGDPYAQPPSH